MYLKSFLRGVKFLRPGKNFYGQKTDVVGKILKGKIGLKIGDFFEIEINKNKSCHLKEHEILSKKVYYIYSVTQIHEEIELFKDQNSVYFITI